MHTPELSGGNAGLKGIQRALPEQHARRYGVQSDIRESFSMAIRFTCNSVRESAKHMIRHRNNHKIKRDPDLKRDQKSLKLTRGRSGQTMFTLHCLENGPYNRAQYK
jgi:hypothetical protein